VAADMQHLAQEVATLSQDGDLVLAMGAGDVNGLWERLKTLPGATAATPLAA
jgi:UDP-N-acetylmuramate--alanine ligase